MRPPAGSIRAHALRGDGFRSANRGQTRMTVKLNGCAYEHAKKLLEQGRFVDDEREAWSEHHPSTLTEKEFIEKHGFSEYGKWFLALNDEYREDAERHYELPYGDFAIVHRCAVLAAKDRAQKYKDVDIKNAVTELLAAIDDRAHE
jgi:cobalamin biosynthesis Mg chelatase CobN